MSFGAVYRPCLSQLRISINFLHSTVTRFVYATETRRQNTTQNHHTSIKHIRNLTTTEYYCLNVNIAFT